MPTNALKSEKFPLKNSTQGEELKILTPKQMLQRLSIALKSKKKQGIHLKIYLMQLFKLFFHCKKIYNSIISLV